MLDNEILHFFNVTLGSPMMDHFWLIITHLERQPLFVFLILPLVLLWLFYTYGASALKLLLVVGLTVGISDAMAYRGIKSFVNRQRPFQNPEISQWLRKVGDAQGPSFPSNHAANTFAGACILAWYFRRPRFYFYSFAGLVALSRVALGVHYPSDVAGGAILGITVAFLVRSLLLSRVHWFWLRNPVPKTDSDSGNRSTRYRRLEED